MKKQSPIPQPLQRKIVFTPLLGMACLAFGIASYISAKDRTLLILSGVLFFTCIFKGILSYRTAIFERYQVICGTCVRITPQLLGKLRKIHLMNDDGIEIMLQLPKQHRIAIGSRYRFYFAKSAHASIGNTYLDTLLSTDSFLGYELEENCTETVREKP